MPSPGKTPRFLRDLGAAKMPAEQILSFSRYRFDLTAEQVWRGEHAVKLTPKALVLLRVLVTRAGELITKEELLEAGWPQTVVSDDALTACIQELRRVFGDNARQPRYIETVHRRGFRFICKVASCEHPAATMTEGVGIQGRASIPPVLESRNPTAEIAGRRRGLAQLQAWLDRALSGERQLLRWRSGVLSLAGLAIIIGTIVLVQNISLQSPRTPASLPPPQGRALALPDKPSIAVLPFINMSGDRDQEYFSDGITDDLITDLSRLPGLFVIARESSFTYKGKPAKLQDVGSELGVRYVLEGSVRKAAGKVRITVQLADAATGAEVWAERYDRPLRDVFALQDEIVRRIVTTLNLQIGLAQQGVVIPRTTENLEAYDDVLRGTEYQGSLTKGGNAKARALFERAIELDPRYAFAYASLAANYRTGHDLAFDPDPHALGRALQMAQRAVVLDDSLAVAHEVLPLIYESQGQLDPALNEAERSIILDPNSAAAYSTLGTALDTKAKPLEALAALENAMRLDPRNKINYLWSRGWSKFQLGRWGEALQDFKSYLARFPDFIWAHALLAIALFKVGDPDMARVETAKVEGLAARTPRAAVGYSALVYALSEQGKPVEAMAVAEKGLPFASQEGWRLLFFSGTIYRDLGRWDESVAALKRVPADRVDYVWLHVCLAYAYDALDRTGEAQAEANEVQRVLGRDPEMAGGYRALAYTLLSQRKAAEALTPLEKGMRLDSGRRVEYLWPQGVAYARLGHWQQAISALKDYSAYYPDRVLPHAELAIGYTEIGRAEAAREEMAEALRLYPRLSLPDGLNELHIDKQRLAVDLRRAGVNLHHK
jgi:TolB-like protein/DNA-binding winged helix-turn-helix (wHTH) protein/predicted Zn-dependent protease